MRFAGRSFCGIRPDEALHNIEIEEQRYEALSKRLLNQLKEQQRTCIILFFTCQTGLTRK